MSDLCWTDPECQEDTSEGLACQVGTGRVGLILMDHPKTHAELLKEIDGVLDSLREGLAMHAGNVELVGFDMQTGLVQVRLQGSCIGCPMANVTLKAGIEETLMSLIPEVKGVVNVEGDPDA